MGFALDPTASLIATKPFPRANAKVPKAVSAWIDDVVPCLTAGATQSQSVTDAVIAHLRSQGVSDDVIAQGLALNSYRFTYSFMTQAVGMKVTIATMPQPSRSGVPPAPQMHSISPGQVRAYNINAARILDARYKGAAMSHNSVLMRALLKALIDILVGVGEPFNDMQEDKEEIEEVQKEILQNAETMRGALRRGSGPGGRGGPNAPEWEIEEDVIEEDIEEFSGEGEAE